MKHSLLKHISAVMTVILFMTASFGTVKVFAEDGPVITKQPESAEINYPQGASFHVEVADPDSVASYQWEVCDAWGVYEYWEPLDGSGLTDTFTLRSTDYYSHDQLFRCVVTDKNGNSVTSETAYMAISNHGDSKPVLYVGDYAVEPGQTLNVADTGYGTGTVTYDPNGIEMTFENVKINATDPDSGHYMTSSFGAYLLIPETVSMEYYMHFKGDNEFTNLFFDEEYNSSGVTIGAFFQRDDSGNVPTLIIDGDGLTVNGGSHIYTNSNLEFGCDVTTLANGDHYCDSLSGNTILIDEGVHVSVQCNGSGIHTDGDLRMYKDSVLDIEAYAPHVSVGATVKQGIFASGSIYMDNATINVTGGAKQVNFIPYGSAVGMYAGINLANGGSMNLDNSKINVTLSVEEYEGDPYVYNLYGIVGGETSSSIDLENGSQVTVSGENKSAYNCAGISIGGKYVMSGSSTKIDMAGGGEVSALEIGRGLESEDSSLDSNVRSLTQEGTYGVVCDEAKLTFTSAENTFHSIAENGVAFAASTGELSEEAVGYKEDYEVTKITLSEEVRIITPKDGVISTFGVPGYGSLIVAETVFDPKDTSSPASEVLISLPQKQSGADVWLFGGGAALVIAAMYLFLRTRKNKTK